MRVKTYRKFNGKLYSFDTSLYKYENILKRIEHLKESGLITNYRILCPCYKGIKFYRLYVRLKYDFQKN